MVSYFAQLDRNFPEDALGVNTSMSRVASDAILYPLEIDGNIAKVDCVPLHLWWRVPESLQGRGELGRRSEELETIEAQNPFHIGVLRGPAV